MSHSPIWPPTSTGRPVRRAAPEPDDPARPGLQRELGGRPVAPRSVEPERRDRRDGQVRRGAGGSPPGASAGCSASREPVRPHDRVGAAPAASSTRSRSAWSSGSTTTLCFDDDEEREQRAVVAGGDRGARRRPPAQRVALGRLDLDDVGAAVGEELGAVRAGDPGRQVDDDGVATAAGTSFGHSARAALLAQPPLGREPAVEVLDRLGQARVDRLVGVVDRARWRRACRRPPSTRAWR